MTSTSPAPRVALGNPRKFARLLELLATGTRRPRALATALDVETRHVQVWLLAAEWLGLAVLGADAHLTAAGLEVVYADARRTRALAAIVREHPGLREGEELVSARTLAERLRARMPAMTPAAARRLAGALLKLVEPAWRQRVRAPAEQLGLAFASAASGPRPAMDLRAGIEENPDAYALVLRALLDAGELSPPRIRAVLDAGGAGDCAVGGMVAMALRRGDATRAGDDLVVTRGAVDRRELAESVVSIALSDPEFRAFLVGTGDPRRFAAWAGRLFGKLPREEALDRLLFGRSLASFPLAGEAGDPLAAVPGPFLAAVERPGIAFALPSSLVSLHGGLAAVNRALRSQNPHTVRPPAFTDRRLLVHGGLLSPGEAPPRGVPDLVTLRARLLRNVPAFALLAGFGVLDRRGRLRLRHRGGDVLVEARGRATRTLGEAVGALATARSWVEVRGPTSATWAQLVEVAEALGLLARAGEHAVLDEALFFRMQTDPEHRQLAEELAPLVEAAASAL